MKLNSFFHRPGDRRSWALTRISLNRKPGTCRGDTDTVLAWESLVQAVPLHLGPVAEVGQATQVY